MLLYRSVLFLLIIITYILNSASADCGCGPQCASYSDATKCTRCCTHSVKRSLRILDEAAIKRKFLWPEEEEKRVKTPIWTIENEDDDDSERLVIRARKSKVIVEEKPTKTKSRRDPVLQRILGLLQRGY